MARETVLVHVVTPAGERHEIPFAKDTPPAKILAELGRVKRRFGFNAAVLKPDTVKTRDGGTFPGQVPHPDPASGFVFDHPDCVVVVGADDGHGNFIEHARIKGPPDPKELPDESDPPETLPLKPGKTA